MKTLFFMGRNSKTKSGTSWKIWKIERKGRRVLTKWGPARVIGRKVVAAGRLQTSESRTPPFPTAKLAEAYVAKRIRRKLGKGYQVAPRRRS
jgi:hypothetical protein